MDSTNHYFIPDILVNLCGKLNKDILLNLISTCKNCRRSKQTYLNLFSINLKTIRNYIIKSMNDDKLRIHLIEFLSTVTEGHDLEDNSMLPFLKNIRKLWRVKIFMDSGFKDYELPETLIELGINGINNIPKFPVNLHSIQINDLKKSKHFNNKNFNQLLDKLPENLKDL